MLCQPQRTPPDAAEKTTGSGKYTDDLSLPGMLYGKILHSPHPHARIKSIDTSRAERLDGVIAVVTGKDAPNPFGILPVGHDEHALALDKVRYVGVSDTYLTAVVPDEGTQGYVTVTTNSGTLTSSKKFKVIPVIKSFTPTSGPVGTQVTITGGGFHGATKVTFGGVKARSFAVDSGSQITATVPTGAVTGKKFVREQFFLAAVAQNIKRLVRFLSQPRTPVLPATT